MLRRSVLLACFVTLSVSNSTAMAQQCPTCLAPKNSTHIGEAAPTQEDWVELFWGATMIPTDELSDRYRGMVVQEVVPGGSLDSAGVEPGMIILEVNGQPVTNVYELKFAISNVKKAKALLAVRSGSKTFYRSVRNTDHEGW